MLDVAYSTIAVIAVFGMANSALDTALCLRVYSAIAIFGMFH
jgi:hypothetical protein